MTCGNDLWHRHRGRRQRKTERERERERRLVCKHEEQWTTFLSFFLFPLLPWEVSPQPPFLHGRESSRSVPVYIHEKTHVTLQGETFFSSFFHHTFGAKKGEEEGEEETKVLMRWLCGAYCFLSFPGTLLVTRCQP